MSKKKLHAIESGHLQYEQAGYDMFKKTSLLIGGQDHSILYPGEGSNALNIVYFNIPGPNPYWAAVQALTNVEVTPLQMETYKSFKKADDFCKDGTFSANSANYLELSPGDIVYGKFKAVSILKPTAGEYNIRLIRGV